MVIRNGDDIRLAESGPSDWLSRDPPIPMGPGTTLLPLLARLKGYPGSYGFSSLSRPISRPRVAAVAAAAAVYRPYPSSGEVFICALTGRPCYHCFTHVAHLLDVAGLTPTGGKPLSLLGSTGVCSAVCNLPGKALTGGYWYADPVSILYDLDAR